MSSFLPDGTCVPSYLQTAAMGYSESMGEFDSHGLMLGEVKEIIYPTDKRSVNKKFIEYKVSVQYRQGSEPAASVEFVNCQLINTFGGIADKFRYTFRADSKDSRPEEVFGIGSKVLILCLNGESSRGYIVGGSREEKDEADKKEDGHNLFFEFNGISFAINKDGEAKLVFRGRTDHKNELDTENGADEAAQPTTVAITKDGNLTISTKEEAQFIRLNHKDKKLEVLADTEWNVKVNEKWVVETGKDVDFTFGAKCSIAVQNDIEFKTSMGKIDIGAAGNVNIKSMGVHIGGASEMFPMFSTYRQQEMQLHTKLMAGLGQLAGFAAAAGIGLNAASVAHKVPVAGPIAGSVPLQAAAVAITNMVPAITQLIAAITTFEAASVTYLSLKNKND